MKSIDILRPRHSPAKEIYDAFQQESEHRDDRDFNEWVRKEREAVWRAARDYAQQHNLTVPTMDEVEKMEISACGHVDYGAKWAYGIASIIVKQR